LDSVDQTVVELDLSLLVAAGALLVAPQIYVFIVIVWPNTSRSGYPKIVPLGNPPVFHDRISAERNLLVIPVMDGRLGFRQLMRVAIRVDPLENVIEIVLADGRDVRDQRFAQLLSVVGEIGLGWSFIFRLKFARGICQRGSPEVF
jgi:hypothetical protein